MRWSIALALLLLGCPSGPKPDDTGEQVEVDSDGDGFVESSDCDDGDPAVHPGADEVCNDLDDDCDGFVDLDDPSLVGALEYYADSDSDGYGSGPVILSCEHDPFLATDSSDCDDADADVNPGVDEVCNGIDDDCDHQIDEDLAWHTWYTDADGDGYGDPDAATEACEQPSDGVADDRDCDDTDAAVNPAAQEVCNGIDDDCDGLLDGEDDSAIGVGTWYLDDDGDGWGDSASWVESCSQPGRTSGSGGDCDDSDASVNPGASEYCNGVDDDCDGSTDESALDASTWCTDADLDGFGDLASSTVSCSQPAGSIADCTDCDDTSSSIHPGGTEYCNGDDDDCDGVVDNNAVDESTWYYDGDSDGYGDADWPRLACDQPTNCVADDTDCDDGDASINPGATEICDGVDQDCDGDVDEGASGTTPFYADTDGDGYGDAGDVDYSCVAPSGYVASNTDCDDTDAAVNPAATELCNGVDDDCDGTVDVGAADGDTWYFDADGDGYGDASTTTTACNQPTGYTDDDNDCDDTDSTVNPGATETCNSTDDDCDGSVDEDASDATAWYADLDGDGYGDDSSLVYDCGKVSGALTTGGDCDDSDPTINPGATEYCDGVDTNCDGTADPSSTVTFVSSAGAKTDLTSTFTLSSTGTPTTYAFSSDGTLYFCAGSYAGYVQVTAASAAVVGPDGAAVTELSGWGVGTQISVGTGAAALEVSGITLLEGVGTNGGTISSIISGLDFTAEDLVIHSSSATNGGGIYEQATERQKVA